MQETLLIYFFLCFFLHRKLIDHQRNQSKYQSQYTPFIYTRFALVSSEAIKNLHSLNLSSEWLLRQCGLCVAKRRLNLFEFRKKKLDWLT